MTIFGDDLSSYQDGVNIAVLTDPFVICKCTEGTYYTDADYPVWRQQAASSAKLFIAYHFISAEDPDAQAKHVAEKIGDTSLPLMIDFEPAGAYKPTLQQLIALVDACSREGLHVAMAYLPRWYWEQIGSPSLTPLDSRGISLVSSAYPGGSGYPGDNAAGWEPYGGMTPLIYQFTNAAPVQGRGVDRNAYRGTAAQLAAKLRSALITGDNMPVLDSTDIRGVWAYSHGDSPDVHQTLANAASAAGQANGKLDQVLQLLKQQPAATPTLTAADVDALAAAIVTPLAAAIAAHIPDVDAAAVAQAAAEPVAHAVLMHMGADLSATPAAS